MRRVLALAVVVRGVIAPTEAKEQITFAPLPLITMQYTNKPTGIHQVTQFGP